MGLPLVCTSPRISPHLPPSPRDLRVISASSRPRCSRRTTSRCPLTLTLPLPLPLPLFLPLTQVLAAYDVEMPAGLVPICADGEVEEFVLLPIREVRARARVRARVIG